MDQTHSTCCLRPFSSGHLRLVGINATQVYTMVYKKKVAELGDDDLVSVGRIQTPILRLIVDRANAIKDFKKVIRAPSQ